MTNGNISQTAVRLVLLRELLLLWIHLLKVDLLIWELSCLLYKS